jgi:FAD/FMN-containing dehydrogenase/Fe-S oxidoreductase
MPNTPVQERPASGHGRNDALERRLVNALEGEVAFDSFTRGRFSTDASIYQIMPTGVVFPKSAADLEATLKIAGEGGVSVTMRGAGTSQNGQPIGAGLVVDCSRYLNRVKGYDPSANEIVVEPGIVLQRLNAHVRADDLFFPVEPSTASRCTLGGMAGNNSCGARSLRYGKMVDNVTAIGGLLADGQPFQFASRSNDDGGVRGSEQVKDLARNMLALAQSERAEIGRMYPKLQRRIGGYNLDELLREQANFAGLLVGSEGTLVAITELRLKLARLPLHRVLGVCHFPSFRDSMATTQHIVRLGPTAVELIDHNVLTLGAEIPLFKRTLADITKGQPKALLLVEFAGEELEPLREDLRNLAICMADHGFADAVVEVVDMARQRRVWEMREACLNIVGSMKGDGKPISFIEDCAVPLEALADYTDAITELFSRHGTWGTWYAHASVGCLHVRPILNMKKAGDVRKMRAIAEAACELVKKYHGSYSGEHGDGISRSEFIAPMFGERLTRAFESVKDSFDSQARLNPGKVVRPYRMDDRSVMRFGAGYRAVEPLATALDWSDLDGFGGAVEMCNNNGACRQMTAGTMCPSFRATQNEQHVTRGRANSLRLAISGQLGPDAFTHPDMKATLDLCVSCKGCKRECPTGVDMAKMKIEFLHHYYARHGRPIRERLIAHLPHYAPLAAALAPLMNARDALPGLGWLSEKLLGFSARRTLPRWTAPWREAGERSSVAEVKGDGKDIVLLADTFNRYFEPENLAAGERVLRAAGYRLHRAGAEGRRPLCCGRTFLAAGDVENARREAQRTLNALRPFVMAGARVVGLEPSCLLTFRDEFSALMPKSEVAPLASASYLFEELLAADATKSGITLPLVDRGARTAHLHGHCHQKAFNAMDSVERVLHTVPGLTVKVIEGSCCGMAGSFGYGTDTIDVSIAMAELTLLPALRNASKHDLIVADGTSCRHQIHDGVGRQALHVARVLDAALPR